MEKILLASAQWLVDPAIDTQPGKNLNCKKSRGGCLTRVEQETKSGEASCRGQVKIHGKRSRRRGMPGGRLKVGHEGWGENGVSRRK